MAKISIIIPAYNAEKYIKKALDSLKRQTMEEIEIICVNDGSTDKTLDIIKEYSKMDHRFIIVNKKNEGIGLARRDGIMKSTSKYITFLDSDDYFEDTFCEKMYLLMEEKGLDLLECGYNMIYKNNSIKKHYFLNKNQFYNEEDFFKNVFCSTIINGDEAVVMWNKVYRKDIIMKAVKDYGNNTLEDYIFNMQYYTMVSKYYFLHETLMNYMITENSITKTFNKDTYNNLKKIQLLKESIMNKMKLKLDYFNDASKWYCKYTKNFLIVNNIYFRDKELFNTIINDSVLKSQSKKCKDKNWFNFVVDYNVKILIIIVMMFYILIKHIKKLLVKLGNRKGFNNE